MIDLSKSTCFCYNIPNKKHLSLIKQAEITYISTAKTVNIVQFQKKYMNRIQMDVGSLWFSYTASDRFNFQGFASECAISASRVKSDCYTS